MIVTVILNFRILLIGVSKSKRSIESMCLNGGFQPKPGLPCVCPKDYYGIQCEFLSNGNITNPGLCRIWSCRNNAVSFILYYRLL